MSRIRLTLQGAGRSMDGARRPVRRAGCAALPENHHLGEPLSGLVRSLRWRTPFVWRLDREGARGSHRALTNAKPRNGARIIGRRGRGCWWAQKPLLSVRLRQHLVSKNPIFCMDAGRDRKMGVCLFAACTCMQSVSLPSLEQQPQKADCRKDRYRNHRPRSR